MAKGTCPVIENGKICGSPIKQNGYCTKHYLRWYRHGDTSIVKPKGRERIDPAKRFWPKVDKDGPIPEHRPELGPCWVWTASRCPKGYGYFGIRSGVAVAAHRFVYELEVGPIPGGLTIDHLCRHTSCVNPAHLEPVTAQENYERGKPFRLRLTHCKRGHPFDEANTYWWHGERMCIACMRQRQRDRRARLKQQQQELSLPEVSR